MERELPVTHLDGIPFKVDIQNNCIIEVGNLENTIRFYKSMDMGNGYQLTFDQTKRNWGIHSDEEPTRNVTFMVPYLKDLDPEGAMVRYNTTAEGLKNKSDYDLISRLPEVTERLKKGYAEIKIGEEQFKLTICDNSYLESLTNPNNTIYLSHLTLINDKKGWPIIYDPQRNKLFNSMEIMVNNPYYFKNPPKEIQILRIPPLHLLDPIGLAVANGLEPATLLLKYPIERNLEAEIIEKLKIENIIKTDRKVGLHVDQTGKLIKKSKGIS